MATSDLRRTVDVDEGTAGSWSMGARVSTDVRASDVLISNGS